MQAHDRLQQLGLAGQVHIGQIGVRHALTFKNGVGGLGPQAPAAQTRAGILDPVEGEFLFRRQHAGQGGQRGIAQLAAILVGNGGVAFIGTQRRHVAGRAVQEKAGRAAGVALHHFAHRAIIVRRDQLVAAAQRHRMAGIIHHGGDDLALRVGDAAHQHRVVGGTVGIDAAKEGLAVQHQIAVARQIAAARAPRTATAGCAFALRR